MFPKRLFLATSHRREHHHISIMPPPPKPKPPHKMNITMNSLRNTTMSVSDDKFYYEVVTRYWHPNLTKIIKHDFETRELEHMADIEGLQTQEPRVRFGGEKGEWIPATDFVKFTDDKPYALILSLVTSAHTMISGGTFTTDSGIEYRWKAHRGQLQVRLTYSYCLPTADPIHVAHPRR